MMRYQIDRTLIAILAVRAYRRVKRGPRCTGCSRRPLRVSPRASGRRIIRQRKPDHFSEGKVMVLGQSIGANGVILDRAGKCLRAGLRSPLARDRLGSPRAWIDLR